MALLFLCGWQRGRCAADGLDGLLGAGHGAHGAGLVGHPARFLQRGRPAALLLAGQAATRLPHAPLGAHGLRGALAHTGYIGHNGGGGKLQHGGYTAKTCSAGGLWPHTAGQTGAILGFTPRTFQFIF